MVRVLIVGAGTTGSLCAYMLRKQLPTKLQCQIVVWEKSRGCGGRMATFRHPDNKQWIAELGAQYIIQDSKYDPTHVPIYNELLHNEIFKQFDKAVEGARPDSFNKYFAPAGLSSIAKYFFSKSSSNIFYNQRLESLRMVSEDAASRNWNVWEAASEKGNIDHFDAVIITSPVPQILGIDGLKTYLTEEQIADLETVEFSSRFAIGAYYKPGKFNLEVPYVAKYVSDNEIIVYFAIDHAKRGVSDDNGTSIIVHTTVPYGIKHLDEDKELVGPHVLKELRNILPELAEPDHVKFHKWKFSQVTKPTTKFQGCIVAGGKQLLILAGDSFTHSNFDGCVASAVEVGKEIKKWIETRELASKV